ncbi:MAG TPA: capsule biosynthesis protein CapA, partial [Tabrizicola sp.]|nr:capsule biosynthesis protein CapA [Tabrizicola sp.]
MTASTRKFLFLQGPHGPWFHRLGKLLRAAGAEVWRAGFNFGDRVFWPGPGYIPFQEPQSEWPARAAEIMERLGITDLVLYGDTRPIHAQAVTVAKARGITVHVFEEGYLRPYWVSYERGGSNGHSRLMTMSLPEMEEALTRVDKDLPDTPATWG